MASNLKIVLFFAFASVVTFILYFLIHAAPQPQSQLVTEIQSPEQLQPSKLLFKTPQLKPILTTLSPTFVPTVSPSTKIPKRSVLKLLSLNKPVRASVHGNLGDPSVITNEKVEDWLVDRWQGNDICFLLPLFS